MAARRKKKEGDGSGGMQDNQKLQAILLADSFKRTFVPVAFETPNVLLPLVNVPMLEYTLEFLSQNGVEEVFIFCVWHAAMIREYLSTSKWETILSVRCITSSACTSPGDALRELDTMGIVRSDPFILISGDVVSNMNLQKAIDFHKEVRKKDSQAIMTVVMKTVQKRSGIKPITDDLVVAFDSESKQMLLFEDDFRKSTVSLPAEIIQEHPNIDFKTSVLDCHVDICSPELLLQFSDNFDYQDIRRHFIENEVVNWELGMHVYSYFIEQEYAARVHDPRTYHSVCRDIVRRWTYPMVPDAQLLLDTSYSHHGRNVYMERNVRIHPTANIGVGVVIGADTVIEEGCDIRNSVIGRNCLIRRNCVLSDSHIWGQTTIEEGAKINFSIVCNGAMVRKRAVVPRGCVLSFHTSVGAGVMLSEYTRITTLDNDPTADDTEYDGGSGSGPGGSKGVDEVSMSSPSSCSGPVDASVVGEDGRGVAWPVLVGDYFNAYNADTVEVAEAVNDYVQGGLMRASSLGCMEQEAWKDSLWVNENNDAMCGESGGTLRRDGEAAESSAEEPLDPYAHFLASVSETVVSGFKEVVAATNVLMEIKSLKFAHNKEFDDCLMGALPALLEICGVGSDVEPVQLAKRTKEFFSDDAWGYQILSSLIQGNENEATILSCMERIALSPGKETFRKVFHFTLQAMYEAELVSDESILAWADTRAVLGRDNNLVYEPQIQQFLEWLREDDDDDDDDDDDEDDDDDDDDDDEDEEDEEG